MNYTDEDVQAIVDTQVELKTKELQQRIDKAIKYLEKHSGMISPFTGIRQSYAQEELGTDEVDEVLSILQCEEVKDNENNNA